MTRIVFLLLALLINLQAKSMLEKKLSIKQQHTLLNLEKAYNLEKEASLALKVFANTADEENLHAIAALFRAIAFADSIHNSNLNDRILQFEQQASRKKQVWQTGTTLENLNTIIDAKTTLYVTMYPKYIAQAQASNMQDLFDVFTFPLQTERIHRTLLKNALRALTEGKARELPKTYYVCSTCGNIVADKAPVRCSISMTPGEKFVEVN